MSSGLVRSTILLVGVVVALLAVAWWLERGERAKHASTSVVATRVDSAKLAARTEVAPGTTLVTADEMHTWDMSKDGDRKAYRAGDLVVTLSKGSDGEGNAAPQINVTSADGRTGHTVGQAWSNDTIQADFGVGRIDPANNINEVVFSTYSGGAHCCIDVKILELTKSGWTVLDLGDYDGDSPPFPKDANGTATPAFVLRDDRFLYAFASHADSYSPPIVYVVSGAKVVDMSASGKYRAVFEKDLKETDADCQKHQNGACAAYVADAARLGRFDDGWTTMLKNYNKSDTWELPADCDVESKNGDCPKGHEHKFDNYPDALRAFLARNGYIRSEVGRQKSGIRNQ